MGYDGYLLYGGVELANISRTVQLAEAMGINMVWYTPESVEWIEDAVGGADYADITEAPWYDSGFPASAEFAGIIPLSIPALGDSTYQAVTTEYVTDGGNSSAGRNATLPLVASVAVMASTQRGADFGKRWMERVLRGAGTRMFCSGSRLEYFRYPQAEGEAVPPFAHYRDVSLTRSVSVTRKRSNDCSVMWLVTFTWTANDPFEYGDEIDQFSDLGGTVTGPMVSASGEESLTDIPCPEFNYTPIYDPLYPALVAPPTVPNYLPQGWTVESGDAFTRSWVRLTPTEPSALRLVPLLRLHTSTAARMVRVSIFPGDADVDEQCDPLFSVMVMYLPIDAPMYIDGEQQACYVWDGTSEIVRRSDSLVYAPDATPVDWTAFNDAAGLLVALDAFDAAGLDVRASLSLIPKSD